MTPAARGVDARAIADRYLHEILSGTGPATTSEIVSNELLRQRTSALRAAFPDLRLTVRQVFADGDLIAVHATASGTHQGWFEGVPATGRRWSAGYTAILQMVDGRIADFWETWDNLTILEQLGAIKRIEGVSA